ncbi:MAG: hypothetical protein GQ583_04110 [Methyloprofundus sp.]|nr:hypothetical protein [Methyloprofundus sp.]
MDNFFTKYLSLSLLTTPALVLTIHQGVGISAVLILCLSLIVLLYRYPIDMSLSKKEKILISSIVILPVVIAFDVVLRDFRLRYLDFYLRFVLSLPIYFALRELRLSVIPLVIGILMGAISAGIFALYQKYYLNELHAHGEVLKIIFGNISLLLGVMSLAGLFIIDDIRCKKTFYSVTLLAFILGITGSLLSGARGGWIAMPFFIGLFILYFPASQKLKIASVIVLILGVFVTYKSNSYVESRIDLTYKSTEAYFSSDKLNVAKTSAGIRLELWKATWMIVSEHPILGVGSGQFKQALQEKIDLGKVKKIESYDHAHNEPLQILVTTGIVGFLAYLALYAGITYYFYSSLMTSNITRVRYLSFLGIMLTGAYLHFGLTNYSFGHHVMILFFALMVVVFAGMIKSIENELMG